MYSATSPTVGYDLKIEMMASWTNMKNTGCSLEGKTKAKRMQ